MTHEIGTKQKLKEESQISDLERARYWSSIICKIEWDLSAFGPGIIGEAAYKILDAELLDSGAIKNPVRGKFIHPLSGLTFYKVFTQQLKDKEHSLSLASYEEAIKPLLPASRLYRKHYEEAEQSICYAELAKMSSQDRYLAINDQIPEHLFHANLAVNWLKHIERRAVAEARRHGRILSLHRSEGRWRLMDPEIEIQEEHPETQHIFSRDLPDTLLKPLTWTAMKTELTPTDGDEYFVVEIIKLDRPGPNKVSIADLNEIRQKVGMEKIKADDPDARRILGKTRKKLS